jgi:hypothetical protein
MIFEDGRCVRESKTHGIILNCLTEKYDVVGRLLKPGEEPTNYSDDEEDTAEDKEKSKDD